VTLPLVEWLVALVLHSASFCTITLCQLFYATTMKYGPYWIVCNANQIKTVVARATIISSSPLCSLRR
jgi:hypothetical protein